jgi:hypothetical protein
MKRRLAFSPAAAIGAGMRVRSPLTKSRFSIKKAYHIWRQIAIT